MKPVDLFRGRRPGPLSAAFFLVALIFAAIAAPALAPFDPTSQDPAAILAAPGEGDHILGTDDLGRDVLSRIIYGSRSALLIGTAAAFIAGIVGSAIGLGAALAGTWIDAALMVLMDSILAFPTILAAMTVVTVFGFGLGPVALALALVYCPGFARLARTETLAIKDEAFVHASQAFGYSAAWVAFRHIAPNIASKILTQMATVFALAVSVEASLSYLGLGTQPPAASWGLMLKDARAYLLTAPWLSIYPGLAVFFTVLAASTLGDALAKRRR